MQFLATSPTTLQTSLDLAFMTQPKSGWTQPMGDAEDPDVAQQSKVFLRGQKRLKDMP